MQLLLLLLLLLLVLVLMMMMILFEQFRAFWPRFPASWRRADGKNGFRARGAPARQLEQHTNRPLSISLFLSMALVKPANCYNFASLALDFLSADLLYFRAIEKRALERPLYRRLSARLLQFKMDSRAV